MANLSVADVLDRAADLIEPEGAWTRGHLALNAKGKITLAENEDAVCFCGYGAIIRAAGIRTGDEDHPAWKFVDQLVGEPFPNWQDDASRDQADVVAKLRQAAALARAS